MFISPQPFVEARAKLGDRTPIASDLNSAQWKDVPLEMRERAFFSSTVGVARFLQDAQNMLVDSIDGTRAVNDRGESYIKVDRNKFIAQMRDFAIRNGMGPLDPRDADTLKDIRSVGRLGLIYDVNIQAAHDFGYWKQGMNPDVLNAFPVQRFIRERRVRVPRPYHVANTGAVRRKDDLAFWLNMNRDFNVPWGPWGYNSGMGVEDGDRAEAEALGLVQRGETIAPIEKAFNENLAASTRGLGLGLVQYLRSAFGDQVTFDGDQVNWTSQAVAKPPAPAASNAASVKPPVSKALHLYLADPLKSETQHALDIIDSVHTDGDLIAAPVNHGSGSYLGQMSYDLNPKAAFPISFQMAKGPWPALTMTHEIGHYLDLWALDQNKQFASESSPLLAKWRKVTEASAAYAQIKGKSGFILNATRKAYFLSWRELWARSYAQFIASESSDPKLTAQVAKVRDNDPWRQWADDDFSPIADEIRAIFQKKGWM